MRRVIWLAIVIGTTGIVAAQPSPPAAGDEPGPRADTGSGSATTPDPTGTGSAASTTVGSGSGSGSAETTFEPTVVPTGGTSAPSSKADSNEPLVLDQIVIGASQRLDFNFFGDFSALKLSDQHAGFSVGPAGFQVTAHLSPQLVGRIEYVMSYQKSSPTESGTVIDVERVYLEYKINNWMLAAGRTHTELGYWNNAFHHGRWLQLTINRPWVLRFEDEGGMLPVHQVGVAVEHNPTRGERGIEAAVGIANGHTSNLVDVSTFGDNNLMKSIVVRLGATGYGHQALKFGINVMVDEIAPESMMVRPLLPDASIAEVITGVYAALRSDQLILFSETYNVFHSGGGKSWDTTDGFVTAGLRFGKYIPYAQFEARHGDGATDPFYNPDPMAAPEAVGPTNFVEGIAGLHYDINSWSALKFELDAHVPDGTKTDYRAELNWSFGR